MNLSSYIALNLEDDVASFQVLSLASSISTQPNEEKHSAIDTAASIDNSNVHDIVLAEKKYPYSEKVS